MPLLRPVLIRNFKQKVTDMAGNRLFQPVINYPETYAYNEAEAAFYQLLTPNVIMTCNAYASGLDQNGCCEGDFGVDCHAKDRLQLSCRRFASLCAAPPVIFREQQSEIQGRPKTVERPEEEGDEEAFQALERWG